MLIITVFFELCVELNVIWESSFIARLSDSGEQLPEYLYLLVLLSDQLLLLGDLSGLQPQRPPQHLHLSVPLHHAEVLVTERVLQQLPRPRPLPGLAAGQPPHQGPDVGPLLADCLHTDPVPVPQLVDPDHPLHLCAGEGEELPEDDAEAVHVTSSVHPT